MPSKSLLAGITAIFAFIQIGAAQGFLKASGQKIVTENGDNILLRGMGLGGWMLQEGYMLRFYQEGQQHKIRERFEKLIGAEKAAEFYASWLENHCTRADIDSMKAWGFNAVRLPMHYDLYTLPVEKEPSAGTQTWLDKGFRMTDSLLAWCKKSELYLILDLHAAPGGQGNDLNISDRNPSLPSLWDSEANKQKTIALWKKLAERYKDEPWIGAYDIINEPNWGFADPANDKNGLKEEGNGPLKALMVDITKVIREVDKRHIIIIEGNGWGNNYKGILPPWDDNMVLSFHKYWNYNDQASIAHMINMREQYNIPVWLGETGENSNVWFRDAIHLLESNNIGWAWWPLKKMGTNNPLQIPSNSGYDSLQQFWSGEGPAVDATAAYRSLMQLAHSTRIDQNIVHRDVIDAMFRQQSSAAAVPFQEHRIKNGTEVRAVDYDLGANAVAYWDKDTANYRVSKPGSQGGNLGRIYRNDGVDIYNDGKEEYVGHIETGEWLQYTIAVKQKARYNLVLLVAAEKEAGKISIINNGVVINSSLSVPVTGSNTSWQKITAKGIQLKKGLNVLRIKADAGGYNLKSIQFGVE